MRVIGLMSGTSHDAVDAAAADLVLDGDTVVLAPLGLVSEAYPEALRSALSAALPPAATTMKEVCALDTRIGQVFAALAARADRELCEGRADLIGSHGQTVYHWAEGGRVHGTLQLGQPAWIAEATGCPVVSDLRTRDVAAGGQGAPLVSLVDALWLRGRPGVCAALNLGGIANITVVSSAGDPLAFDTGPANALIDAAVGDLTGGRLDHDADGAMAARGTVHEPLLERLLAEPYYALPAPKTTGKELFHGPYLRAALAAAGPVPDDDVVATVTELTARTVADAVRSVHATEVIASGGGTRNPTLMGALRRALGTIALRTSDDLGLPAPAKEAYAFAVLAFLTAHGLAGTAPSCTGARHASVLGSITPGSRGLALPAPGRPAPTRLEIFRR
ncbi:MULTISPECIES: anhydro-N-acetylmuramic acid kinase [Streptomyces]|uniref:anhydro-N-acetylmuramic acid kinase n=1 Tax=Streptomyces TaxID=1883 RepID=UPI000A3D1425|nr:MULTISPECIES: anhydro-N-acetylmuramic acid kinase [Streptomyces]RSS40430.1 anhydro-N-acetylmuramic acid kinase [Streptomyces sp. WAC05858]WTA85823.1 anhydro-N-acetylmuramic acid kinase [Streptomyces antimycoticus]WTB03616.1 anhydro-N-acetylmuramic acid kinase [Streptomyces antimycoticus]